MRVWSSLSARRWWATQPEQIRADAVLFDEAEAPIDNDALYHTLFHRFIHFLKPQDRTAHKRLRARFTSPVSTMRPPRVTNHNRSRKTPTQATPLTRSLHMRLEH